jgi:hypothetical protein
MGRGAVTAKQREAAKRRELAEHTMEHLIRGGGSATVTTATFRLMLLLNDGYMTWRGKMYEPVGKSLGAGVYRVRAKEAVL